MQVAILFGGVSPEHEVSIKSAENIFKASLKSSKFNVVLIGISKTGKWFALPEDFFALNIKIGEHASHQNLSLNPGNLNPFENCITKLPLKVDVVFPITHGNNGEDGLLQGLLDMLGLAYVGPNTLASAMCMDKDITKQVLAANGIAVSPGTVLYKNDIFNPNTIVQEFGLPLFVKPANMGSGVGVYKCSTEIDLIENIEKAFKYDHKILIEKAIIGREVEVAVLGNLNLEVSNVGEIIVNNGFYTYENKYVSDATIVNVPAKNLSESAINLLKKTALKAYKVMQLSGLSRIDFFYIDDNTYYLNEINTLPGFTNISMYPQLMKTVGYEYTALIEKLISLALERKLANANLVRSL